MAAAAANLAPWELLDRHPEDQCDAIRCVPLSVDRPAGPTSALARAHAHDGRADCRTLVSPPALLVHGLAGTTSVWLELAEHLQAIGVTVAAFSYRPFGTSVEQLAEGLVGTVETLLAETGADKLHLVGHSLGGVVIAHAFADGRLTGLVDSVVTIAAPFGGSPWASVLPLGATIRALRRGSPQLGRLATAPVPVGVRWLAICSNQDMIVPGRRSMPTHSEVESVTLDGVGHLGLLSNPDVIGHVLSTIRASTHDPKRACPEPCRDEPARGYWPSQRRSEACTDCFETLKRSATSETDRPSDKTANTA